MREWWEAQQSNILIGYYSIIVVAALFAVAQLLQVPRSSGIVSESSLPVGDN